MKNKFIYFAVVAALGFASCEPEFENEISNDSYSAGEADFTSYVALGNSLTAGCIDGTVSKGSQMYSFPNLLAQQFSIVGGGEFTQPDFTVGDPNNVGGLLLGGMPIEDPVTHQNLYDKRFVFDETDRRPERIQGIITNDIAAKQEKAYHNMGVTGAKSTHINLPGYGDLSGVAVGTANPWYVRHATANNATILGDAMSKNPTFFTNWVGDMDVLAYATSGGVGSTSGPGPNDITPLSDFVVAYDEILNTLTNNGTNNVKGVVFTIPYVTSIPYFTTVPFNPVPIDASTAALLNGPNGYGAYNAGLAQAQSFGLISSTERASRTINFEVSNNNAVVIVDESLTDLSSLGLPSYREATIEDLVVLPASSFIGTAVGGNPAMINGVSVPLADKWVLTKTEKLAVDVATDAINAHIRSKESANIAVADMNVVMKKLTTGLKVEDGTIYTADYFNGINISSVLFSLDGVHPNARGYAVITNEVINVINKHFKSKLPLYSAANFPGINLVVTNN